MKIGMDKEQIKWLTYLIFFYIVNQQARYNIEWLLNEPYNWQQFCF